MIDFTINTTGIKCWWKQGQLHRLDGPARILPPGRLEYWVDGRLHRLDGPARIYSDGHVEYWINSQEVSEYEYMFITTQAPV